MYSKGGIKSTKEANASVQTNRPLHSLRRCEPDQVLRVHLSGSSDPRPEQFSSLGAPDHGANVSIPVKCR